METKNKTVLITGNTFAARTQLKDIGGVWVAAEKCWQVPADAWLKLRAKATPTYSRALCKALEGLVVKELS